MNYRYIAYDGGGKILKGTVAGSSEAAAEQTLQVQGYQTVSLKPSGTTPELEQLLPSLFHIRPRDITLFSRQLATMLEAGVSIIPALQMLQEQTSNRLLRKTIKAIQDYVCSGSSIADAFTKHISCFGELYCKLVTVGEQTGRLEDSLRQAANYIEKSNVSNKKVKKALTYPTIVLSVGIIVIIVLALFVLPSMLTMFTSLNAELPTTTRLLVSGVNYINAHRIPLLISIGVIVIALLISVKHHSLRHYWDSLLLRIPLLGPVNRMNEMARLSQTMALLIHAGLDLPDIIDIAQQTSSNCVIKKALINLRHDLLKGQGLAGPVSRNKIFPRMLAQMIKVGEESGNLESALGVAANSYESEADERMSNLIALIEPATTIIIGGVVAFIALSIITPMYSIMSALE